jgi:hypothetical protein
MIDGAPPEVCRNRQQMRVAKKRLEFRLQLQS